MTAFDSSDEGEIIESGAEDLKATSLPQPDGSNVDRRDRPRGRYSRSPDRDDASSRRSRSPRGHKRPRRDTSRDRDRDYYGHKRHNSSRDTRRFQVRYEDSLHYDEDDVRQSRDRDPNPHGPRRGTPDFDGRSRDWDHRRDRGRDRPRNRDRSRDRHLDRRFRNRSRSPRAFSRGDGRRDGRERRGLGFGDREERAHTPKYGDHGDRSPRDLHRSKMAIEITKEVDAKTVKGSDHANGLPDSQSGQDAPESMLVDEPEPEIEEAPVDIEAEIERRRRRRDELLAKSRADTPTLVVQALHLGETAPSTPFGTHGNTPHKTTGNTPFSGVPSPRESTPGVQEELTPPALDISNDQELINTHGRVTGNEEDGPSAADYDPTVDMKEDGIREELRHGHYNDTIQEPESIEEKPAPPQKDEADDDDFDMFAEDFDEDKYAAPKAAEVDQVARAVLPDQANAGGILEGADKDGYYKIRIGEILNGRYQIETTLGKGMFSGVARARDITNNQQVAIKMMRNNDALRKGGFTEIAILQKINSADPDNKKHIVKFERYFDHKQHLCMVFENLSLNLREVLRKFGNNVGINLVAVRAYARQIFIALAHLKHCSIIHADLKPDNILVNETRNVLKICDLGTAVDRSDAATAHDEVSPYLVSRFYRAPEIILGMPYDFAVDMWSIGCTLYELYTGKILFTGESNNQMLKAIMEIRGKLSSKLYRRGQLSHHHFDEKGNFISVERDKLIIGKSTVKILPVVKPTRDLRTRLVAASTGMGDDETKLLNHFIDLLERCLALNPDRRITPSEALKHPFFNHHPSRVHPSAGRKV